MLNWHVDVGELSAGAVQKAHPLVVEYLYKTRVEGRVPDSLISTRTGKDPFEVRCVVSTHGARIVWIPHGEDSIQEARICSVQLPELPAG